MKLQRQFKQFRAGGLDAEEVLAQLWG